MKDQQKRIVSFVLAVIASLGMCFLPATAITVEPYDFANFSEVDSMNFIESCGIHIPEKLSGADELASFTKNIIIQVYNDPDIPFGFNYDKTAQYAEDIRAAVKAHMSLSRVRSRASATSYSLQYNTVMDATGSWVTSGGYWDPNWENYNCYAYAIHRADDTFYESIKQYQPGDMCGEGSFNETNTVGELAEVVKNDLIAMGYQNIELSPTIPSVNSSQELICLRISFEDYHFMRYDIATNAWYHKPGNTAVLKYNMVPSNGILWCVEVSEEGVERGGWLSPYDSDIVYIRYSKNQINVSQSNTTQKQIPAGKDRLFEINITGCAKPRIQLTAPYSLEYEVYDKNLHVVTAGSGRFCEFYLSFPGTYYLRMSFVSADASGYVNIETCKYTYWDVTEEWHSYSCEYCGEANIEQPHEFIPQPCSEPSTDYSHYLVCHCGYLSYGYCSYDTVISYTDTKHVNYCLCGSYYISNHVFVESPVGSDYNWVCRDCGHGDNSLSMPTPQSLVSGNVMMQMSTNGVYTLPDGTTLRILTESGSYVLSNGIIVLSPEDAALAEAGLLDPYELVENINVPSNPDHVTE